MILGWLMAILGVKPKELPTPIVPQLNFKLAWSNQEWTNILISLVKASTLPTLKPKDVLVDYPWYVGREVEFWCQLISIMAKYESGFKPETKYEESGHLAGVISRGLLQISFSSGQKYNPDLKSAEELHDVRTNLYTGIKILERWVTKHNQLMGTTGDQHFGGSKYWSVLRAHSDSKPKIIKYLKSLSEVVTNLPEKKSRLAPYEWALNELKTQNTKEVSGSKDNPRIVWYHSFTSLKATDDETPWCSSFMCAAAEESGHKSTKSAGARSWLDYGDKGDGSVGDIAVFKREKGHHVAFINKPYTPGDNEIEVLGGNQGNRLSIDKRDSDKLLAIRRFKET